MSSTSRAPLLLGAVLAAGVAVVLYRRAAAPQKSAPPAQAAPPQEGPTTAAPQVGRLPPAPRQPAPQRPVELPQQPEPQEQPNVAAPREASLEAPPEGAAAEPSEPAVEHGVLLFYHYFPQGLPSPHADRAAARAQHEELCLEHNLHGRLRIAREGLNGNLTGTARDCIEYVRALTGREPRLFDVRRAGLAPLPASHKGFMQGAFQSMDMKLSPVAAENLFSRLRVWEAEEVCGLYADLEGAEKREAVERVAGLPPGQHLSPDGWDELLQKAEQDAEFARNLAVIDCRNDFEAKVGHFEAPQGVDFVVPSVTQFSQFPDWLRDTAALKGKQTIAMYCTGGVRCERASALAKETTGAEVVQLEGGVQRYLDTRPDGGKWLGRMYVFDRRKEGVGAAQGDAAPPEARCEECAAPARAFVAKTRCTACNKGQILLCQRCADAGVRRPCAACGTSTKAAAHSADPEAAAHSTKPGGAPGEARAAGPAPKKRRRRKRGLSAASATPSATSSTPAVRPASPGATPPCSGLLIAPNAELTPQLTPAAMPASRAPTTVAVPKLGSLPAPPAAAKGKAKKREKAKNLKGEALDAALAAAGADGPPSLAALVELGCHRNARALIWQSPASRAALDRAMANVARVQRKPIDGAGALAILLARSLRDHPRTVPDDAAAERALVNAIARCNESSAAGVVEEVTSMGGAPWLRRLAIDERCEGALRLFELTFADEDAWLPAAGFLSRMSADPKCAALLGRAVECIVNSAAEQGATKRLSVKPSARAQELCNSFEVMNLAANVLRRAPVAPATREALCLIVVHSKTKQALPKRPPETPGRVFAQAAHVTSKGLSTFGGTPPRKRDSGTKTKTLLQLDAAVLRIVVTAVQASPAEWLRLHLWELRQFLRHFNDATGEGCERSVAALRAALDRFDGASFE